MHNNLGSGTEDIGLVYMAARWYSPTLGRFISADTIVPDPTNPQSYNRYSYVLNRPLNFTDPAGHRECGEDCNDPLPHFASSPPPPLISVQDWEMQLMAMVAYFETTSASEQQILVIWTILNRLDSPAFSNSVEKLLVGTQYHVSLRNPNAEGIYQNGIFAAYKDPKRAGVLSGQALANAAFAHYSQQQPLLNEALIEVQNAVAAFNNGGPDPTNGAVYFAHGSTSEWQETVIAGLERQAEIDGLSSDLAVTTQVNDSVYIVLNNIYDPPFTRFPYSGGYCKSQAVALCQIYLEN